MQQVGSPQAVYDLPANTFVAAFLGSPRINLHVGQIDAGGGNIAFEGGSVMVPLGLELANLATRSVNGAELALGVRPEDIDVRLDSEPLDSMNGDSVSLEGRVTLVEPVGSDLYVRVATGAIDWMARTEARLPVQPGQSVTLRLNMQHAHLFGEDGTNLAYPV